MKSVLITVSTFIVLACSVFFVVQHRNTAYILIKNNAQGHVELKIDGAKYLIKKRYEEVTFVFPLSGEAKIELPDNGGRDNVASYCEIKNKPFGLCGFEVIVDKDGISCGSCFSL